MYYSFCHILHILRPAQCGTYLSLLLSNLRDGEVLIIQAFK